MKSTKTKVESNITAPTNAELAQNMVQLIQTIGSVLVQNQHQQRLKNRNDVAKLVAKRNPPCYLGQEDPLILEDWIRTFDKLFDAINCPADQRINTAAYYLRQEADNWWATTAPTLRQQPDFSWETFKEAMRKRFYPEHVRAEKYEEFLHLKQVGMTVQEYHSKFLNLALFAPTLVLDEIEKTNKFIRGLNFETQKALCISECQTLNDAYNKAGKHYQVQQLQKKTLKRERKGTEEENRQGGKRQRLDNAGETRNRNKINNQGQDQKRKKKNSTEEMHFYCSKCGKDHPGKYCDGTLVRCFHCDKLGHRVFECHSRKKGIPPTRGLNHHEKNVKHSGRIRK
ncbi:unnamed protein product [Cuscuta epithymum]|uniref:Retrotransposon gag domain-containing protein n=2 Tax=Cuscuta epithymum TaxID=186058 RepID=A0AAV0FS89_9ASTE|nr:unnamed protein product [Cuscuta epithymum]CAH9138302.1 unnamed protein product [Cuscuta epithymum]